MKKTLKVKKLCTLFFCVAMILTAVSGCGSSPPATDNPGTVPEAETANAAQQNTDAPSPNDAGEPKADGGSLLPITEEKTTITYWFEMSPMISAYLENMNDNITWQYIEETTNVHIDFWAVSANTGEMFNLMIASGNWADIMIWGSNYYAGGAIKAVEEGIFMELTDVIDSYMPNYKQLINSNKDILTQVTMNNGLFGEIFPINHNPEPPGFGPIVRKDWLDDLGIDPESIVTYDDYYDMLTKFKVEKGATSALYLNAQGVPMSNYLIAGYGIAGYSNQESNTGPFYQESGTVKYGFLQPEFKDYLTMIHQWYSEGLISSDFISVTSPFQIAPADVTDGSVGLWYHMSQIMEEHVSQATQSGFESIAIKDAVMKPGDKTRLGNYSKNLVGMGGLAISADCSNIDVVAKWIDFFFSDEGSLIMSYGIEGETYYLDAQGKPHFSDLILNNPDMGMIAASNVYAIQTGVGYIYEDRFMDGYTPAALAAGEIWMETLDKDNMMTIPESVKLSTEDSIAYASVYPDIATYTSENIAQFIVGARPLSEFDAFVSEIENLGIYECIKYWQNALDNYNSR